ncbi:MAG: chemotaxis protein CheA [Pseudomonadota bacterium]
MAGGAEPKGGSRNDPMADIKASFFQECEELLEELVDGLEALRAGSADQETFNSVFRAVHSIKGGAAAFALNDLTDFAHGMETRLAAYRDAGTLPPLDEIAQFEVASDRLAALVTMAAQGVEVTDDARLEDAALLTRTEAVAGERKVAYRLTAGKTDIRQVLRGLKSLGAVEAALEGESLPDLEVYDPETCTLAWQITLSTDLSEAVLKSALSDLDPNGALTRLDAPVDAGANGSAEVAAAAQPLASAAETLKVAPTIRVGLDRIDRLINLVGELVINQAMLSRSAEDMGAATNSDHMLGLDELMRLTRDIQDSVMQIRAQPVKPLFQRMARICREAASVGGKTIELVSEGQDTEIDKTVIERLADPLTHMIRNAVDHAIEAPEGRLEAGKPEAGKITLRASHRSGQVVLEVIDDGAGIDREKVLARARDKGLVAPGAELSPSEIDHLLFLPGFSTADQVSSLSGRGVGMDVVRAAIHGLGGRITIESTPGEGTRFDIALPLTLAVLDAMIVSVADQTLVFPLSTIHETTTIEPADQLELTRGQRMLRYGGKPIALFDLGEELGYHGRHDSLTDRVAIITASEGQPPVALAIDEIYEQRQVVIKGLQEGFSTASCVAAATILGDGRIALIIDPFDASLSPGSTTSGRQAVPIDLTA